MSPFQQQPIPRANHGGKSTGGHREWIEVLAGSAVAAAANGILSECHPEPSKADIDGTKTFYLEKVGEFVSSIPQMGDAPIIKRI